jgi:hypothetical protein
MSCDTQEQTIFVSPTILNQSNNNIIIIVVSVTMPSLEKLIYIPHGRVNEHPLTMVLMVDGEAFGKYKKDHSIPLAEVVDSFDVLKYENPGTAGLLNKPSYQELNDVFGTTDEYKIVEYMLEYGTLSGHVRSS